MLESYMTYIYNREFIGVTLIGVGKSYFTSL